MCVRARESLPSVGEGGNRGGVLLGLGLVRDRLDRPEEALPILEQAYQFYKQRAGSGLSSLCGKAGVSTGMVHLRLGDEKEAEKYIREAIHIYEVTCGETSPLTGGAYFKLGQILWEGSPKVKHSGRPRRKQARKALKRAYEIEAMKDAFTIIGVLEIHNMVTRNVLSLSLSLSLSLALSLSLSMCVCARARVCLCMFVGYGHLSQGHGRSD